ncbi:hypothetical protein M2132_001655 [Dysgonomonas sp. PH5-45]|uniref:hypothetical protein n=1 Tax=unclassified Dysgonomonas TaxID=2630389 RepID=UPI002474B93C|nr:MULTISPECIES: hypothetical protein [unclassified Dysgonomonas]MDH6355314.1 hypothetical protein [Dysgonomonas sp. PH5-45]MDH6388212.1 hypothetical protein [Dysgonomonas sp. PH5-37]
MLKKTSILVILFCAIALAGCKKNPKEQIQGQVPNVVEQDSLMPRYSSYCNGRYGFCINYPTAIFFPQGESDSGDGQIFLSEDKCNELRVYRDSRTIVNNGGFSLQEAYNEDINENLTGRKVKDNRLSDESYFVTGIDSNGNLFYQKSILSGNEFVTAILSYQPGTEQQYEDLIVPIFSSLK